MTSFDAAVAFVLRMEGGYVNDPDDPGGATNMGITQAVLNDWRITLGQSPLDVQHMPEKVAKDIYYAAYWVKGKCHLVPDTRAALAHFDACVNVGIDRAVKLLQTVLGVTVDGDFGPKTQGALTMALGPNTFVGFLESLLWARVDFYRTIAKQRADGRNLLKFLPGWLWRVLELRKAIYEVV